MTHKQLEEYNHRCLESMGCEVNALLESLGDLVREQIDKEGNC